MRWTGLCPSQPAVCRDVEGSAEDDLERRGARLPALSPLRRRSSLHCSLRRRGLGLWSEQPGDAEGPRLGSRCCGGTGEASRHRHGHREADGTSRRLNTDGLGGRRPEDGPGAASPVPSAVGALGGASERHPAPAGGRAMAGAVPQGQQPAGGPSGAFSRPGRWWVVRRVEASAHRALRPLFPPWKSSRGGARTAWKALTPPHREVVWEGSCGRFSGNTCGQDEEEEERLQRWVRSKLLGLRPGFPICRSQALFASNMAAPGPGASGHAINNILRKDACTAYAVILSTRSVEGRYSLYMNVR